MMMEIVYLENNSFLNFKKRDIPVDTVYYFDLNTIITPSNLRETVLIEQMCQEGVLFYRESHTRLLRHLVVNENLSRSSAAAALTKLSVGLTNQAAK